MLKEAVDEGQWSTAVRAYKEWLTLEAQLKSGLPDLPDPPEPDTPRAQVMEALEAITRDAHRHGAWAVALRGLSIWWTVFMGDQAGERPLTMADVALFMGLQPTAETHDSADSADSASSP
ncbi:hypothetical protein F4Y93_12715 [Candidatus Poribacteria bacterium]|nr:hypothetical protein [Candidatus Poribacteria bacterium]